MGAEPQKAWVSQGPPRGISERCHLFSHWRGIPVIAFRNLTWTTCSIQRDEIGCLLVNEVKIRAETTKSGMN
jgi:hypothetical protein